MNKPKTFLLEQPTFLKRRGKFLIAIIAGMLVFSVGFFGCKRSDKDPVLLDDPEEVVEEAVPEPWIFTDVTASAGFNYLHGYTSILPLGTDEERQLIAGGVAAGDYDRDGWVDLYVVRGDIGPNLLFRNLGDGTFEEVGAPAGVALDGEQGSGPVFGDYDGDGWLDLLVPGVNDTTPTMFRTKTDGIFEDVTASSGIAGIEDSLGASFGDYDLDGDIDLYIAHWLTNNNAGYLWENDGNGSFIDVSTSAGIPNNLMDDFTPNFSDIDNDGWPDLLIAADFGSSQIFHNNGDGTFTNVTTPVITDENGEQNLVPFSWETLDDNRVIWAGEIYDVTTLSSSSFILTREDINITTGYFDNCDPFGNFVSATLQTQTRIYTWSR